MSEIVFAVIITLAGIFFTLIGFDVFNPLPKPDNKSFSKRQIWYYRLGGILLILIGSYQLIKSLL